MMAFLLTSLLLGADAFSGAFQDGNRAYQNGDFPAAARSYEQLADSGIADPVVFHNLGNAWFRSGALGYAIANYERALQLDPLLDSARENLGRALALTKRSLPRPKVSRGWDGLLIWRDVLTQGQMTAATIVFWVLFWFLLAVRRWKARPYLLHAAGVTLLLAGLFALSAWEKAHPIPLAVAVEETVAVRFGASESEALRFELFEGDRVEVEEITGDWAKIRTAGGERGWASRQGMVLVGPPYETAAGRAEKKEERVAAS